MASAEDVRDALDGFYEEAEEVVDGTRDLTELKSVLGSDLLEKVLTLGKKRHAARGVALTLFAYKAVEPSQDIRSHKAEHPDGFSARSIDNLATVPFLTARSLPHSVESHWLTQSFSMAGPFQPDMTIKTQPKIAGPLLVETVVAVEDRDEEVAGAAARAVIVALIEERNKGKVALARPKVLTIDQIVDLLGAHLSRKYERAAPRLPQLAVFAAYQCLVPSLPRYGDCELAPLLPMKAADRKARTVGDVVVKRNDLPFEGVEVKHGTPVVIGHMTEAIAKLESAEAQRYFILSTAGVAASDAVELIELAAKFRSSNGCEIIIDGVLESIGYYLRLIDNPVEFVNRYAKLLEEDEDLGYEHRIAWNELCEALD